MDRRRVARVKIQRVKAPAQAGSAAAPADGKPPAEKPADGKPAAEKVSKPK